MNKCICTDDELRYVGCHCGSTETPADDGWVDQFLDTAPAPAKAPKTPHQILEANLSNLSEKDREFAMSLLRNSRPSDKVRHWIGVMAERATKPAEAPQAGGFLPIYNLLHAAAEKLQRPVVRVAVEVRHPYEPGKTQVEKVRLTIAGPRSKYAGSINITAGKAPAEGQRDWYGSISPEGRLYLSGKFEAFQGPLRAALERVAADPAGAATLFGQLTSACCFCGRELTDGASIAVGYGPICAGHYGLPHGEDHGAKGGYRQQAIA